ncbi:hypothetical protein H4J58_09645 [Colwellia sp. MB3u-70]|uniref:hypothetical protein n=1 Tax=unclassified Colwellia TaxID=196834 RepID=UPI0015F6D8C0|nr:MULTISPECIES: hypothetical protein [unclassified Colwellia]MBA6292580.1 hypothetical protein [Colwellia sp. MB3u-8]MBA6307375.1 hypothetical protein [Colwellia sp. MB3u-70]
MLIASRGMALAGFFLLPSITNANDFKQYVLYFAVWQFCSQLLSMQLGTTFFRCGLNSAFTKNLHCLLSVFYPLLFLALLAFISTLSSANIIVSAFFMSVIVAVFIVVSEYARAKINERLVFCIYMLPGLLYLTLFAFSKYLELELSLSQLLFSEAITYAIMTMLLLVKCEVKISWSSVKLIKSIKRVLPFWYRISFPLIPNNLLWYFYFNVPIVIGYRLITDVQDYNEMALLFRFVVAISTVSSLLALVFQKRIVNTFEHNKRSYGKIKHAFLTLFIPSFFVVSIIGYFVFESIARVVKLSVSCGVCDVAFNNVAVFIFLFYMFFSIYLMSHYFVAEKNLTIISPSMFIGFVVYVLSVLVGLNLGFSFSLISIYSLCISLTITFIIRYFWSLKQEKI